MRLCGEWVWCVDMCVWLGVGLCVRVHVLVRKVGETSLDFQSVLLLQMCRNMSRAYQNSKVKGCRQGTLLHCTYVMTLGEKLRSGVNAHRYKCNCRPWKDRRQNEYQ